MQGRDTAHQRFERVTCSGPLALNELRSDPAFDENADANPPRPGEPGSANLHDFSPPDDGSADAAALPSLEPAVACKRHPVPWAGTARRRDEEMRMRTEGSGSGRSARLPYAPRARKAEVRRA